MTLTEIKQRVESALFTGYEFTSHELACRIWPDFYRSPLKPTLHPMSNQVSMALKQFPSVIRDRKTKKYKVL